MNLHYKELSDRAFHYHSNNKLKEAEEIYKQLLNINPDDLNILNLLGLLYLAKNKPADAICYLSKAFILKKTPYIVSNLAKAYYMNDEPLNAIKLYKMALSSGETDDIYYSIALAYKKLKDYDSLIANYKKALELNPKHYNACYNLSIAYKELGKSDMALFYAEKCTEIKNNDDELYALISGYYEDMKCYTSSIEALRRAIFINNSNYLYFYNLGVLLARTGKINEAEAAYIKSIELNKSHIESYVNLASLYKNTNNNKALEVLLDAYKIAPNEENLVLSIAQTYRALFQNSDSIDILNKFLNVKPLSVEAYGLLAINYMDLGEYTNALSYYDLALNLAPENFNIMHGKAVALKYLGNISQSKKILEYIVSNNKDNLQSAITLGMMYLTDREFEKGMSLYSLRSKDSKFKEVFKNKIWNKDINIEGKNLLLYTDCGLGDTIMYARYLPLALNKAKSVTLQTDKELVEILKINYQNVNVIQKGMTPPEYDVVMPFMDLPIALNADFNNIPYTNSYVKPDENDVSKFADIPEIKDKTKKIGLCWQGNKKIFKNRSIPFDLIKTFIKNKDYNFYSFQLDADIEETENFYSLKKYINNYKDTAALLKNMDILITIDSSIVHMAGALGIKTYLLLPQTSEWRWFNDEKQSSWYDSVTIFKQKEAGNWTDVLKQVERELCK